MVRLTILALSMLVMVSAYGQDQQHWKVQIEKSEMTDTEVTSLTTIAEGATPDAPFGVLGVACSAGRNAEVVVYTTGPEYQPSPKGLIEAVSHWHGRPSTEVRMRFDSSKPTGTRQWVLFTPRAMLAWGSGLGGPAGKTLVKKLMESKRFLIEYPTFSGETKILKFDVSGLQEAIKQVPECKLD